MARTVLYEEHTSHGASCARELGVKMYPFLFDILVQLKGVAIFLAKQVTNKLCVLEVFLKNKARFAHFLCCYMQALLTPLETKAIYHHLVATFAHYSFN